jgi:hypothetical protein
MTGVTSVAEHVRNLVIEPTPLRALPRPPLFKNDATFIVDRSRLETRIARNPKQEGERALNRTVNVRRHGQPVFGAI